jgi:MSHA biogenesis protein MshJ
MNEKLKQNLTLAIKSFESRTQSEKIAVVLLLICGLVMVYLTLAFDPYRASISGLRSQISGAERQIQAQQTSYASMVAASQEDPNKFANERLSVIAREQSSLDAEISRLAGDLTSPADMTRILTSVLERQSGLELINFENRAAVPLRADSAGTATAEGSELDGQVFEHGLVIEFQGDFFSTLKYLRFIEEVSGSFFWDSVSFRQIAWPEASVTLEIHTLSANAGFIGV